ncbi:MAG: lipid-binding SYLF domain-containing protein [Gammaproteobacteria bacterium]|nr:lipid-binding SYLF domain-containing protein [Gammaproteobacteria bacterium]MDH5345979.1 lipid-binding SYLF domain-containing protein [Gammaproteobacteria bacterium]
MKNALFSLIAAVFLLPIAGSAADSATVLDARVDDAIADFKREVNGADVFLRQASGYLVFPRVIKVGIGLGAETGEGALRVAGRSAAYYRTTSGSFGFQLGAQAKSMIIAFMTDESLAEFRASSGWQVGIDGSVALIDLGAGKQINSANIKDPVVGFIYGSKGLMYNLTLEGTKFSRIQKD